MRFAIIASARTGSSHLTNLLNSRPDILCNGEICHQKRVFVHWPKEDRTPEKLAELAELRGSDPARFLERIFETNYERPNVGFKILRGQQKQVFDRVIEDRTIRKIILFRRNVLANFSSKLIARETGEFSLSRRKASRTDRTRPEVCFDPDTFIALRRKYERYYASVMDALFQSGQNFHVIDYEEINNRHFFMSLLSYIGADLSHEVQEGKLVKQNPSNIVSRFSNPEAVEAFLREQELSHWSYEGQVSFDIDGASRRTRKKKRDREPAQSEAVAAGGD